jgi:inhibitor of KinA
MRICSLAENAIIVEFGGELTDGLNDKALWLAKTLDDAPFPGFIEAVPAYASTAVFFDPRKIELPGDRAGPRITVVIRHVERVLDSFLEIAGTIGRSIEVPFRSDPESAPDLEWAADVCGMSVKELLDRFAATEYRVYMLGFLPGFAYMGEVDENIALPRKETPRLKVPKGSIGIAGRQTGIYPFDSPGGWQIIGKTNIEIFDPENVPPCLFEPGDRIRFRHIDY